ncbi:Hypothetical predicted protein [Marmota monax]|uniref:Uncharacterized protein n=1 Tax=Marmota monax TaxID=9995 RepID=A0A5E4BCS7_MARMO|nr:hypothetical protein GHT09_012074 [Marmota monax]VTJ67463.1 Hypothetical predicted protein [Marmota monax]
MEEAVWAGSRGPEQDGWSCPWSWKEGASDVMAGYLFFLENDAPHLESLKTETDLDQDPDGSGEQEGELALTEEGIQVEGDEVKTSGYQEAFEDEEAVESGPPPLEQNLLCPREEDIVQIQGDSGCKTCRYLLVQTPKTFSQAQVSGQERLCRVGRGMGAQRRE